MNLVEAYSFLFSDCVLAALILPMHYELVFDVMLYFGGYNSWLILILATLGSMIGQGLNYFLGRILQSVKHNHINQQSLHHNKFAKLFGKYNIIWLTLSFIPTFGSIVFTLCGFFNMRPIVLIYGLILRLCYYGCKIYAFNYV